MAPQITGSMTLLCSKLTGQSNLPKLFCRSNYCRLQTSCGHPPCEPFCSVLYTLYTTAELTYLRCLLFLLDMSPSSETCSLEVYQEQATGEPPTVRAYHSFDALAQKCYVIGGRSRGNLLVDKDQFVCVYDAATKQWLPSTHLPNPPISRSSHGSLAVSRNQLLICGGTATHKQRLDDTHVLKIGSKGMSWSRLCIPPLPTGLKSLSALHQSAFTATHCRRTEAAHRQGGPQIACTAVCQQTLIIGSML